MEFKTFKVKGTIGDYPGYESDWWTEQQWEEWSRYREGTIFSGEFGKEVEIEITMRNISALDLSQPAENYFTNFAILMPK